MADKIVTSFENKWFRPVEIDKNLKYSLHNDVLIIRLDYKIDTIIPKSSLYSTITKSSRVKITYRDVLTGQLTSRDTRYVPKIASAINLSAITTTLNSGASGCPVIDLGSNAVVGMISSQTGEYSNMTICIPITTINNIIETADFNDVNNYDDEAYQFLNISTEILTPTIINSVPSIYSN